MGVQNGLFVRCGLGRTGLDPHESADGLRPTADFGDIVPHCVRPEVARERAPGRWGCRFVREHGLGRVHGLPQYILEGVRKFEDVSPSILCDFLVTCWEYGPGCEL